MSVDTGLWIWIWSLWQQICLCPENAPNAARFIRCHLEYSVRCGNPYIGEYGKVWIINRSMRNKEEKYINH